MRIAILGLFVLCAGCGGGSDVPSSRPSDLATPSATGEASEIRSALAGQCSEAELDIAMEGFAIVALTTRFNDLTAAERAELAARDEAYQSQRGGLSGPCQAEINKLV